eukprot:scaffold292150_cov24-Tisochrysis_lutea.AAC.1
MPGHCCAHSFCALDESFKIQNSALAVMRALGCLAQGPVAQALIVQERCPNVTTLACAALLCAEINVAIVRLSLRCSPSLCAGNNDLTHLRLAMLACAALFCAEVNVARVFTLLLCSLALRREQGLEYQCGNVVLKPLLCSFALRREQAQPVLAEFWDACAALSARDPSQVTSSTTAAVSQPG